MKKPQPHLLLLGVIHRPQMRQDAKIAFNKNLLCLNKQNPLYWNGQTKENSILIVANGVGECVLASRQINSLRQYAERVGIITKPQFHELAGSIKNIDFCLFSDNPIKGGEKFIQEQNRGIKLVRTEPIMSMNEDIFSHPLRHEKSINVKPNLDSYWRAQMNSAKDGSIPLIGLCWNTKQISPLHPNRSFKLEDLRIVSNLDHYKLASFQNGYGSEQLDVCDFKESFVSCQQELSEKETFLTLSLLLINVIISSHDTGIAQISLALGIKTVVFTQDKPSATWAGEEINHISIKILLHRKLPDELWSESINRFINKKDLKITSI